MADSIQKSSSIPIPPHQTELGAGDLTEPTSARSVAAKADTVSEQDRIAAAASFSDYLNRQQILTQGRVQEGLTFDPAADITRKSPYGNSDVNQT